MKPAPLLFIPIFFAPFCLASEPIDKCSDIAAVDFKNRDMLLDEVQIHFKDGKFDETETLDPEFSPTHQKKSWVEWQDTIEKDTLLRPSSDSAVRVLQISRNHLGGTGNWIYTIAFACEQGRLKQVLNTGHDYGAGFKKVSESEIVVTYGVWKGKDAHASPSIEGTDIFKWSSAKKIFELAKQSEMKARPNQ